MWTPQLHEELREIYRGRTKREVSAGLERFQKRTGWPRHAAKSEAVRLGIVSPYATYVRPWRPDEVAYLEDSVGVVSVRAIARKLHRSYGSVCSKAEAIGLSRRIQDGYNMQDLQRVFGVGYSRVESWMRRGLLGTVHANGGNRVTTDNVLRFVRRHAREYDLRRVDQDWYKAMVFGGNHGAE